MTWADWAIFAIIVISALISVMRGFVREALSLMVWLIAMIVSMTFYQQVATWLTGLIEMPALRLAVARTGLFIVVLIAGGIINSLITKLVKMTGLSGVNRWLGMLFGTVRGLIGVLVI